MLRLVKMPRLKSRGCQQRFNNIVFRRYLITVGSPSREVNNRHHHVPPQSISSNTFYENSVVRSLSTSSDGHDDWNYNRTAHDNTRRSEENLHDLRTTTQLVQDGDNGAIGDATAAVPTNKSLLLATPATEPNNDPRYLRHKLDSQVKFARRRATLGILERGMKRDELRHLPLNLVVKEIETLMGWWTRQVGGSTLALALLDELIEQHLLLLKEEDNDNCSSRHTTHARHMMINSAVEKVAASWLDDFVTSETDLKPSRVKEQLVQLQRRYATTMSTTNKRGNNARNQPLVPFRVWEMVNTAVEQRYEQQQRDNVPHSGEAHSPSERIEQKCMLEQLVEQYYSPKALGDESNLTTETINLCLSRMLDNVATNDANSDDGYATTSRKKRARSELGRTSEIVLRKMWDQSSSALGRGISPGVVPNSETYELVMVAWLKTKPQVTISAHLHRLLGDLQDRRQVVLRNLELHDDDIETQSALRVTQRHYRLLLSACARDGAAKLALSVLDDMISISSHPPSNDTLDNQEARPDEKVYSVVFQAMANDKRNCSKWAPRADELYHDLQSHSGEQVLDPHLFTSYFNIWARSKRPNAAQRIQDLLETMHIEPNEAHYSIAIRTWIQAKELEQAEALLRECQQRELHLKSKIYLELIKAWTSTRTPEGNERAESLLVLMKEQSIEDGAQGHSPPREVGDLLKILSKSSGPGDAEQAERILRRIQTQYYRGHSSFKLTSVHYNAVIRAWSVSGEEDAPDRAEALLLEMLAKYDQGDQDLAPTEHTVTSTISSWARSKNPDAGKRSQAIWDLIRQRCDQGQLDMILSAASYTALTRAWAQVGEPERAEIVLQEMHEDYVVQNNPNARPSRHAFNALITAWAQSRNPNATCRIDQILALMIELSEYTNDIRPDVVSYAAAASSLFQCKNEDVVDRAQEYLLKAKHDYENGVLECKPNSVLYGAVIQAIARSKSSAETVDSLTREMLGLDNLDKKQVQMAMCAAIMAWRYTDSANGEQAILHSESLLDEQIRVARTQGGRYLPGLRVYTEMLYLYRTHSQSVDFLNQRCRAIKHLVQKMRLETDDAFDEIFEVCVAAD